MFALQYWRGAAPAAKIAIAGQLFPEPVTRWQDWLRAMADAGDDD